MNRTQRRAEMRAQKAAQPQPIKEKPVTARYGVVNGKIAVMWDRPIQNWLFTPEQLDEAIGYLQQCKEVVLRNDGQQPKTS